VKQPVASAPTVPQVRATVITIETKIQPDNKTFTHAIVIAGEKARSLDELDHWRLFDLKAERVTFVDEIGKSIRSESLQSLEEERGKTTSEPHVAIQATHETKVLQGVNAVLWTIRAGGYTRDLWLGEHPAIPPQLFSMMVASDEPPTPLITARGFPLAEHAELPYLNKKLVVDKTVTKIESKNVPASLFEISRAYTRR
jgi:D-serine deaminase-like pyridoxal phosphate-dependent protein